MKHLVAEVSEQSQDAKCLTRTRQIVRKEELKFDIIDYKPPAKYNKEIPLTFDLYNATALEKLAILPNPPRESEAYMKHNDIWKVMVWCHNEGLSFDDFWRWCAEKDASETRFAKWAAM